MALLGEAALAMWWDVASDVRAEWQDWHSHEHFPERLRVPGFLRASRWTDAAGGEGMFVLYELANHDVLSSPAYLARLNAPTPWSTRMMPLHLRMVRTQCRVLASAGSAVAQHAATLRFAPASAADAPRLRDALAALGVALVKRRGCVGAHLLQHHAPAIAQTIEQKIRGGDADAAWVLVLTGYDADDLSALLANDLGEDALPALGAAPGALRGRYRLAHSAIAGDVVE